MQNQKNNKKKAKETQNWNKYMEKNEKQQPYSKMMIH